MKMNNKIEFNEEDFVDFEFLCIEKLIEEREAYENEFFSLEPPTEEFDYMISQHNNELENLEANHVLENFEYNPIDSFELEDNLNRLRNEKLIRERELYEEIHFSIVDENFVLNDIFDCQIAARQVDDFIERNGYDYDFKYEPEDYECYNDYDDYEYEEEMFWTLHYLKQSQFEKPKCECAYMDYIPHDDGLCDYMDCYDYPDGPDENLNGIKFY